MQLLHSPKFSDSVAANWCRAGYCCNCCRLAPSGTGIPSFTFITQCTATCTMYHRVLGRPASPPVGLPQPAWRRVEVCEPHRVLSFVPAPRLANPKHPCVWNPVLQPLPCEGSGADVQGAQAGLQLPSAGLDGRQRLQLVVQDAHRLGQRRVRRAQGSRRACRRGRAHEVERLVSRICYQIDRTLEHSTTTACHVCSSHGS